MEFTIYLICLGVGFVFTLFSAIFGHVFGHGGHDGHVDGSGGHAEAGVDASDMPGVSAFSPTVIAFGVLWLLRQLFSKTQSSSESKVGSLVGQLATIITPIPQNGVGEIAYVQAGTRYSAPAREENGTPVPVGKPVKITRVVGTQFYVALS